MSSKKHRPIPTTKRRGESEAAKRVRNASTGHYASPIAKGTKSIVLERGGRVQLKTRQPDALPPKEKGGALAAPVAPTLTPKEPFFVAGREAIRSTPLTPPKTAEELRAHVRRFKEEHKEVLDALAAT